VPIVMVGHARYPAIDPDRIASQSGPVVTGLLRRELGFRGVAMTDSTEAAAVQAVSTVEQAAVRNVQAGIDIVLTTGRGSYIRVYRALLAQAKRDPAFRARVRDSAARVLALQRTLR
jgi:beta-N-acetylhexosaminidase